MAKIAELEAAEKEKMKVIYCELVIMYKVLFNY